MLRNQSKYVESPLAMSTAQPTRNLNQLGVGISQPAVHRRLKRLEREVILSHRAVLERSVSPQGVRAIMRVRVYSSSYDGLADSLSSLETITDLYRTNEDYGLLSIVSCRDISEYNGFLVEIFDLPGVIVTFTTIVLEERKAI